MCLPRPAQRCVAPYGVQPKAPVAVSTSTCVSPTQHSASWPHTQPNLRPSGGVLMRLPHPAQRCVAPKGAPPEAPVAVST
eukprot:3432703-Pyramimonas_sp.AAC.1